MPKNDRRKEPENLTVSEEGKIEETSEELLLSRSISLYNQIGCDEIVQQFISGLSEYKESIRTSRDIPELNDTYQEE
jgi:hypothetical protein